MMQPVDEPTGRPDTLQPCTYADLRRLLEFYLACVEAEDRRSLRLPLDGHGRAFIAPWNGTEPLFHPAADYVDFTPGSDVERKFLEHKYQAGAADRLFYGFPILLEENDYIGPLFILEVEVSGHGDGFRILPVNPNDVIVNHHVIGAGGLPIEERCSIEDDLKAPFGSFAKRLAAAFESGVPSSLQSDEIDALPKPGTPREAWINCPILFRSARSPFTYWLRGELRTFLRYSSVVNQASNTALQAFFGDGDAKAQRPVPLLEIVPLNREQTQAAKQALNRSITLITGPPGTGKSQVVIDVLASCAAAGRPVLFCSKNNKAVDVVRTRLRELLGKERDWTLRLGSQHHMQDAKEEMTERIDAWKKPERESPPPNLGRWDEIVERAYREREGLDELQHDARQADEKLRCTSEQVAESWIHETPPDFPGRVAIGRVMALRDRAAGLSGQGRLGWTLRLARFLMPGLVRKRLVAALEELCIPLPAVVAHDLRETASRDRGFRCVAEALARLLAFATWLDARNRFAELEARLLCMPTATEVAQKIFDAKAAKAKASSSWVRDAWTARVAWNAASVRDLLGRYFVQNETLYGANGREFVQRLDRLTYTIRELGEYLPIWIVTNLSARRSLPLRPALFDLVVIDEASQCDIASALPLLYRARRTLIIGDPEQLRHVSILDEREESELAEHYQVSDLLPDWSYRRESLYDVAARAYRRAGFEPILLAEHFRSHPLIAEFSNRFVYQSRLRLCTDLTPLRDRLKEGGLGVVWHQVPGVVPPTRRSAWNPDEVATVCAMLEDWWETGFLSRADVRFGIVTPFRQQQERIRQALGRRSWREEVGDRLIVGTTHQFQGDECDVMVFSPVVSAGMRERTRKWVASTPNLLNVAITRARGILHVVGDRQACEEAGGLLAEFARYVDDITRPRPSAAGNPAQTRMAELLARAGVWYYPQFPAGPDRFDFLVVSPLGTRYDLEVDGRQHRTPEQLRVDRVRDKRAAVAGYDVIRVQAKDVSERPEKVRARIARLV